MLVLPFFHFDFYVLAQKTLVSTEARFLHKSEQVQLRNAAVLFRVLDAPAIADCLTALTVNDPMLSRNVVLLFHCFDQIVHAVAEPHAQIGRIAGLHMDVYQILHPTRNEAERDGAV